VRAGPPGVTFAATRYNVSDNAPAARILVHRTGSLREPLRFVWWTEDDTAKAEVDYAPLGRRAEQIPSGQDGVTIFVPIISNPLRHGAARFYVALGAVNVDDPRVASERASVTIEHGD